MKRQRKPVPFLGHKRPVIELSESQIMDMIASGTGRFAVEEAIYGYPHQRISDFGIQFWANEIKATMDNFNKAPGHEQADILIDFAARAFARGYLAV